MKGYLKKIPNNLKKVISLASRVACANDTTAYLVGGCVRDLILGVKNFDLDIVVEKDGIKFAQDLASRLGGNLVLHKRFGTASLIFPSHFKIDIATARKESYPVPACLPQVIPGTLKDDLARRDFTINTMAINVTGKNLGQFVDFFGGSSDLLHKKIRVLHELSFIDDPTRIMRAIRFEQRYNFTIEPKTLKFLREALRLKMLERVSSQRLREELILILKEEHPLKQIRRIDNLVGFNFISRDLSLSARTYKLLESSEKQITWFKRIRPQRRRLDSWLIYFMGLLEGLSIKEVKSACAKFAFRAGDKKRIVSYKKINPDFVVKLHRNKNRPSYIFRRLKPLSYEVILLFRAKFKDRNIQICTQDFLKIYNDTHIYARGRDLRKLGLLPGPSYQRILSRVLNARLEGIVKTRKEEIALIRRMIAKV